MTDPLLCTIVQSVNLCNQASNAATSGASAVVMMRNEASADLGPPASRIYGSIDTFPSVIYCSIGEEPEDTVNVPVLGATYQLGEKLLDLTDLSQFVSDCVHVISFTLPSM